MVAKQGDQQYNNGRRRVSWSILEYLGVYLGVYVRDLDLTDKWRLSRSWVWIWVVESSTVWGNIRSIVEAGCARSHETERFHWRGWNLEVFPNTYVIKSF